MPPRKSNVSVATNGEVEAGVPTPTTKSRDKDGLSVEELNLPRTMVQRLAKGVLPSNTQIQKDALLAISKSATVFVNFLASQASENAIASGKKTIMPHDVYAALKENEFDSFIDRVKEETIKYNEIQCDKRNTYRRTKAAEKKAAGTGNAVDAMDEDGHPTANGINGTNGVEGDGSEPPAKKIRREEGGDVDANDDEDPDANEVDDDVDDDADSADEEIEEDVEEEEDDVEEEVEGEEDLLEKANGIRDEALDEPDSD